MSHPLPLSAIVRGPEFGAAFTVERLFDDSPASYWCTPSAPIFPHVMVLGIDAENAQIERFLFDPKVPGYESSAPRRLAIELSDDGETFRPLMQMELELSAQQLVLLQSPQPARKIRLTFLSNHGGAYLALTRFKAFGTAEGVGEPMLPPGTEVRAVIDGEARDGVVVEGGYLVRWAERQEPSWVAAQAVERRPAGAATAPARRSRARKSAGPQ